ncbi:hypothetical protein PV327_003411 [Microctonus hyperodae]|uniref:Phosphatidylinositol-specific phospholipase C X domain-containing protein n=1 Tax=Microctonus hyperodae TaxID=165561 RepID=A0AA39G5K2_MICHY|nr:hypothetical protein PV327_003411 [Microctonus hyperodae]
MGEYDCVIRKDDFLAAQLILFYTPKTTSAIQEQIAIYYHNPRYKSGDIITFVVQDVVRSMNITKYYFVRSMKGIILTKIAPTEVTYDGKSIYQQQCLGYSANWVRNGTTMKTSCLSTHPDWMYQQRNIIRNHKIKLAFIPGTHNSGSYSKVLSQSITEKFTATQDLNIMEQLIAGARYLDLRPAIKIGDQLEYWICHGSFFMNTMDDVLDDIKTFIIHTQEIVILSFKEFPMGFKEEADHLNFIQYLEKKFNGHLVTRISKLWEITFGDIWRLDTRILVSYDNNAFRKSSKMWPGIPQMWGDIHPSAGLEALRNHLKIADASFIFPKVSMPQFTLDAITIASHAIADTFGMESTSLRRLGAIVGHNITQWYNEIFFRITNIVAVDYIDGTGIVEVAIEWNSRRFSLCSNYFFTLMNKNNT